MQRGVNTCAFESLQSANKGIVDAQDNCIQQWLNFSSSAPMHPFQTCFIVPLHCHHCSFSFPIFVFRFLINNVQQHNRQHPDRGMLQLVPLLLQLLQSSSYWAYHLSSETITWHNEQRERVDGWTQRSDSSIELAAVIIKMAPTRLIAFLAWPTFNYFFFIIVVYCCCS